MVKSEVQSVEDGKKCQTIKIGVLQWAESFLKISRRCRVSTNQRILTASSMILARATSLFFCPLNLSFVKTVPFSISKQLMVIAQICCLVSSTFWAVLCRVLMKWANSEILPVQMIFCSTFLSFNSFSLQLNILLNIPIAVSL